MASLSDSLSAPPLPRVRLSTLLADSRVWLAAIMLLAVAVRFYGLGQQSFWADEIASVEIARQPLSVLWSDWMVRETNPPLYYSILHLWMGVAGHDEVAVRALSALIGVLAIPMIYWIGREATSRRAGLIAAFLAALWCHQIYYSQEARGYILGVVGVLIAVIGLIRITDQVRDPDAARTRWERLWPWAAHGIGALLAVYTHTTHVLFPLLANLYFAGLWIAQKPRRWTPLAAWTVLYLLVLAGWAWWGWITWRQLHLPKTNVAWIAKPTVSQALSLLFNIYGPSGVSFSKTLLRLGLLGAGGLMIVAEAIGVWRMKPRYRLLIAVFGAGAPLLLFLISQKVPIMIPRTLMWAEFAAILGLASAIDSLGAGLLSAVALGATVSLLLIGGGVYDKREPWRPLTAELARRSTPGEIVLVAGLSNGLFLQYECETIHCPFRVIDVASEEDSENRWAAPLYKGPVIQPSDLPRVLGGARPFWIISRWQDDPRPMLGPLGVHAVASATTPLPIWMTVLEQARR